MKLLRTKIQATTAVVLFWALTSSGTAWADLLDFLKSPSDLIMNQKNCIFMKNLAGEVVNGRFILSGAGAVVMSMEKLDDNRASARMEQEDRKVLVLDVKKSKGVITATHASSTLLVLECTL